MPALRQCLSFPCRSPLPDCGPSALTPASGSVGAFKGLGLGFSCGKVSPDGITDPGAILLRRAGIPARVVTSANAVRGAPEQAVNKCKDSMQSGHAS